MQVWEWLTTKLFEIGDVPVTAMSLVRVVGDFIELQSGLSGEVREINIRSTLVTTNDNVDVVVPNSEFVNGRVMNWTMREAYRRIHVPFGVD